MEVFRCDDMQRLLSEESYSVYAPCMYRPDGEKYRERMEKYASDPAVRVYLCEDGGKTAGILILDRSGNAAEILGIAVAEDRRRQGIGSRMIRQVMRLERLDRIIARTDAEAVGFYRKCGFSEKKEIVEYPSGTAERYYCELKTPTPSLTLYKPEYGDLWFRQKMLSDEETMAYNRACLPTCKRTVFNIDSLFVVISKSLGILGEPSFQNTFALGKELTDAP